MSIQLTGMEDGLVTVKVAGKLAPADLAQFQQGMVKLIQNEGKTRVLVLAEEFQGWEKGDWGDISFQARYDPMIEKMAIVGCERWRDLALLFTGKGLRRVPIEFFGDAEKARAWVAAKDR